MYLKNINPSNSMSRDDQEMSGKKRKCRNLPNQQQQQHVQYCLSWKGAETATSPGPVHHLGMSQPHSVMPPKQVPLCHRVDPTLQMGLNTTNSSQNFEARDDITPSRRSLPGINVSVVQIPLSATPSTCCSRFLK